MIAHRGAVTTHSWPAGLAGLCGHPVQLTEDLQEATALSHCITGACLQFQLPGSFGEI